MPNDDAARIHQLEAMNGAIERNMRAIRAMKEQGEKDHNEVMGALTRLEIAMFGNGSVQDSIQYRVAWAESVAQEAKARDDDRDRIMKILAAGLLANTGAVILLAVAIIALHV